MNALVKFSRKTILLLLLTVVLVSVCLRYPTVEHERYQTDSYFIDYLSQSIVSNGYATWTFNPLSYFGYYPESYPSGVPFVLAEASTLTGLQVETMILITGAILGVLFALVVFCLARQFVMSPQYAILASFFATVGPRFVDTTFWNGSARGWIVVLIAVVVLAFLRSSMVGQYRLRVIGLFLIFTCFAIHHMAVLFLVFGAIYVVGFIAVNMIIPRTRRSQRRVVTLYVLILLAGVLFLSFGNFEYFGESIGQTYGGPPFDIGPPIFSIVVHAAASYTTQVGLILIVAVLGIPQLFRSDRISLENLVLVLTLLFFIPIMGSGLYLSIVLAAFVSILGVVSVRTFLRARRTWRIVAVIFLVLVSSILPPFAIQRWNDATKTTGDKVVVGDDVYNDGAYLRVQESDSYAIATTDVLAVQLRVISGDGFLGSGIVAATNGDVSAEVVSKEKGWSNQPFPQNIYAWFNYRDRIDDIVDSLALGGVRTYSSWMSGSDRYCADYMTNHTMIIVAIDNRWSGMYVDVYGKWNSTLQTDLSSGTWHTSGEYGVEYDTACFELYQSQRVTYYLLDFAQSARGLGY